MKNQNLITNDELFDNLSNLYQEAMKYSDNQDVCSQDLNNAISQTEALLMKNQNLITNDEYRPQDDWFMKDPKWYTIGNAIIPFILAVFWVAIMCCILFGL